MRIDVSQIEGYENLSAEDKINALLNYDVAVEDNTKLKDALNKASSQAADLKRQLREKQTEQERKEAERAEEEAKRNEELQMYKRNDQVIRNIIKFQDVGYSKEEAQKSAEAMVDGDMETVFNGFKIFVENRDKQIRAELIKGTPAPKGGATDTTITKEQFNNMGYQERAKLYQDNPELYRTLKE